VGNISRQENFVEDMDLDYSSEEVVVEELWETID
jgi:hypothetical protein